MTEQVTLYDLPSRPPLGAWSLNPWKTRFVLNYKAINYKTEWVEYPDIKPTLEKHVSAHKEGTEFAAYTIPTIRLPDGEFVMESWAIAQVLEERYPTPSLSLKASQVEKIKELMLKLMPTIRGMYIPDVPERLLNEASLEHWYRTREARFGMPLDQLRKEQGGEKAYEQAEPVLKEITALLTETDDGPFFLGNRVSYADFIWGSALIFFQRIGDDRSQGILGKTGNPEAHRKLMEALKPWSERSDM